MQPQAGFDQESAHKYNGSYKHISGCCGSRKIHSVKAKPAMGIINIKKKTGFCFCCMGQVNGSARLKDVKSFELETPDKSVIVAYVLWGILGIFGAHRFYTGRWKTGILWAMTLGLAGIGWLLDVCWISGWIGATRVHFNVAGRQRTEVFSDISVKPLEAKKLRDEMQMLQHIV